MRRLLCLALLGLAPALGCASNCASTGWSFQVGRPASMMVPAAVEQTQGPLLVGSLGAGPAAVAAPRGAFMAMSPPACVDASGAVGANVGHAPVTADLAGQGSCTLDDVCNRLARIEQRLSKQAAPEPIAAPMPKGLP